MRPRTRVARHANARALCIAALLPLSAACFDASTPTRPDGASLSVVSRIDCTASVVGRAVACAPSSAASVIVDDRQSGTRFTAPAPMRDVILGNQGGYVKLTSSNINVAGGVFAFDVTLKNLIGQAIGTTNGFSATTYGSRVFFSDGPRMTSGTGSVDFVNPGGGFFYDSTGTFTNANQPFFRYVGLLNPGDVSPAHTWRLRYDPGVLTFAFSVFVSTPVRFPDGYVDGNPYVLTLNPAETANLGGTVRTVVGAATSGSITYADSPSGIVSVAPSGLLTAGSANGITYVSLSSGSLTNYFSTAVNVCASVPTLTSGALVAGTIDGSDCASSFANGGRPDPSFLSDMYRISLTAGQQIAITMTGDGSFTPCVILADPDGKQLTGGFQCAPANTATIPAGAPMPTTGVYTIEAGQSNDFATSSSAVGYTGNYTLSVTVTP